MARGSARTPGRPAWIQIGVLAAIIVVLYATMALTSTWTPRLGLDLQGGTSVILTPKAVNKGQTVNSDAVNKAVDIIRNRVNGLGVAESTVQRSGNQIEIAVPGKGRNDVVNLVGQTAELRFRQVYSSAAATPATTAPATGTTATPKASATPKAAGTPKASATPSATASATLAPSATQTPSTRPKALSRALLAAPAATAVATKAAATATPSPAVTPSAAATPAVKPLVAAPNGTATTPPASVVAYYNTLVCTAKDVTQGKAATDTPNDWLAACDKDGAVKYILQPATVIGTDVKGASATLATSSAGTTSFSTGQWQVVVSFTGKGQGKFTKLTENTIGKQVAIVLDGVVQSAPVTNTRIPGDAQITGSFNQKTATDLANVLKYGALPLSFEQSQAESISPTLGSQSLHGGLLAGALGLALVVLYSFAYYRALGIVTVASLLVSGSMVYACVVLLGSGIGFTLSLAGIAGLIVSVGVTADSFVVFYERLKDEAREGRTVRTSVERGWVRARRTILSADTVSFLAAAVLYLLSIGSVRGFAFTLGLSTILDVVVVFLFTKPVVTLLVRRPFFSTSRFSGLSVKALGGRAAVVSERPPRARLTKRPPSRSGSGPASGQGA